jgi:AP-3 complex subunit delta-1
VKYVALLAFNKIVVTHPYLVSQQEDVIMECIDSPDISIRLRALDLVVGMVSSDNLMSVVGRLMRQLRNSPSVPADSLDDGRAPATIEPAADSDDDAPEVAIKSGKGESQEPLLPDDYRVDVITRILSMCSSNNYANLVDFDWYIDILIQLLRNAPIPSAASIALVSDLGSRDLDSLDVSGRIGDELRTVAVKVRAVRPQATRAAESILISTYHDSSTRLSSGSAGLRPISWIVGEYAASLESPEGTLTALLHISQTSTSPEGLMVYLQALPKIFAYMSSDDQIQWTPERKSMVSLLMARVLHVLEPMAMHPDLEVQERAVEFSELLRLAAEASSRQESSSDGMLQEAPLLLTQAIPSLFTGLELNSVAVGAQKNVPIPSTLDLDQPINGNLNDLLRDVEISSFDEPDEDGFETYYYKQPLQTTDVNEPAINRLGDQPAEIVNSYQQGGEESYLDSDIIARRRAERLERNKDDPFYIPPNNVPSGRNTPLHNILQSNNGPDLDIDAIPIMQLDLGKPSMLSEATKKSTVAKARPQILVATDETLVGSGASTPRNEDSENSADSRYRPRAPKGKSLLQVDSSHISAFSLEENSPSNAIDFEKQQRDEAEMAKAMQEVEKLRMEMQRANDRIKAAQGVEGTVVKKKKKKKAVPVGDDGAVVKKKKKSKKAAVDADGVEPSSIAADVVRSKKKRRASVVEVITQEHVS